MPRRVFLSYHHRLDAYRASQIRNSGLIDVCDLASDDDWQAITRAGDAAIRDWIDEQMGQADCVIVLIGQITAGRLWIDYEIRKAWREGRGLLGIHIHNLKNHYGSQTSKGANPFAEVAIDGVPGALAAKARAYDPPYLRCSDVSRYIENSLPGWIKLAIDSRRPGSQRPPVTRSLNTTASDDAGDCGVSRIA